MLTILIVILILFALGGAGTGWPAQGPYYRGSMGGVGLILIVVLVLILAGRL